MSTIKYEIGSMALDTEVPPAILEKLKSLHKLKLTHCENESCDALMGKVVAVYDNNAVLLECPSRTCGNNWLLCLHSICGHGKKQKKPFKQLEQYKKHKTNTHKASKQQRRPSGGQLLPFSDEATGLANQEDSHYEDSHTTMVDFAKHEDVVMAVENCNSHSTAVFGVDAQDIELKDCISGIELGFTEPKNRRFFQEEYHANFPNGGMHYLASRSLFAEDYHPTEAVTTLEKLPEKTALLQLQMAKLAFSLSPNQNVLLAQIMSECYNVGVEGGYNTARKMSGNQIREFDAQHHVPASHTLENRIPRTQNDIRNCLLMGENSIVNNLPHPCIKTDVPGHSYVSITGCIRDFLGHHQNRQPAFIKDKLKGADDEAFHTVQHPSESRRAKQMLLEATTITKELTGYVFWWTDDVEPNRLSKSGRGSIWIATMTIGTVLADGHNLNHTYPVAIGKKTDNHDLVFQKLEEEMKQARMENEYYAGEFKKKAKIGFLDFAHLGDQPERRGANCLLLGSGSYAARFGVSGNHRASYPVLMACPNCDKINQTRLESLDPEVMTLPLPICSECLNWDILKEDKLNWTKPPAHYPLLPQQPGSDAYETSPYCRIVRVSTDEGGVVKQVIKPFRITHAGLKGATTLAHEAYCNMGWSAKTVSIYLKVEGINDEFIERFLEHAARCYSLKHCYNRLATAPMEDQPEANIRIMDDSKRNRAKYQRVPYPKVWLREGLDVIDWPNAIMHLLCLGIIPTTMQLIQNWLKATRRNTAFRKANAVHLEGCVQLGIEWFNVLRYVGDSFGHWVSKNYLSFGRLMPWFYQNISALEQEAITMELPADQKKWLKKHNEYWLKCRGIDTKGLKEELIERVTFHMAQDPQPSILVEPPPSSRIG